MSERTLPRGFECPVKKCINHDLVGSENSCNGGSIDSCPIVQGFMTKRDREALFIGRMALRNDGNLEVLKAYFIGKQAGGEA